MTIAGVIAEFNPFHWGHQYLFQKIRRDLQPEYLIVCMSGNFVQRGEPAVIDKWARAKMALSCGADLVLELPTPYATSSAELFASAGVSVLEQTGLCNVLCFGSESGDLQFLYDTAMCLAQEPEDYKQYLAEGLSHGRSFPAARAAALQKKFPGTPSISQPNDILAIEYIKALLKCHSRMSPFPVSRRGVAYHSTEKKNGFASATAIRKAIFQSDLTFCQDTMPPKSFEILLDSLSNHRGPISIEQYFQPLQYLLRMRSLEDLRRIADISEGLEHRLKSASCSASSVSELLENAKTKRYTYTRLSRCLIHLLLNVTKEETAQISIPYLRILGFRRESQELLKQLEKSCSLPLVTNPAKAKALFHDNNFFNKESLVTDLYLMCLSDPSQRRPGQEFTQPIVIV